MFNDRNYVELMDMYFAAEEYEKCLLIAEARYAAMLKQEYAAEDMHSSSMDDIRQQRAWFLLLTSNAAASEEFAALLKDYIDHNETGQEYRKAYIEHILDALHSRQSQGRDTAAYTKMVRQLPREHIDKFIRGCNCKKRNAFDTYRHEQYLRILENMGFPAPPAGA